MTPIPRVMVGAALALSLQWSGGCFFLGLVGENFDDASVPDGPYVRFGVQPVDLLLVVDNSESMREAQHILAAALASHREPESPCQGDGFEALRTQARTNPDLPVAEWPAPLQDALMQCGLVERLLVQGNRFHIGVITTDMEDCDQPYGSDPIRSDSVPQRGCLQTSQAHPELAVVTWETPEAPLRIAEIVADVGFSGSAYEKGLLATEHFLTPYHDVPPPSACDLSRECSGDLDLFLRRVEVDDRGREIEPQLVVVFLTDEDDCSHPGTIDETAGNYELCYTAPDLLEPVERTISFLAAVRSRADFVTPVVLAGLVDRGAGYEPSGCRLEGGSLDSDCDPALGNTLSNCTHCVDEQPVCTCHPAMTCPGGTPYDAVDCCQADPATRYHALTQYRDVIRALDDGGTEVERHGFRGAIEGTVCQTSYRDELVQIVDLLW